MPMTYPLDVEEFVATQLTSGRFSSRDELLVEALRAFRDLTSQHQQLQRAIAVSLQEEERGEVMLFDPDDFIQEQQSRLHFGRSSV